MSTEPTFNFVVISPPGAPADFVTGINDIGQIAGWVPGMGFIYTSGAYTTFSVGTGPILVSGDINNQGKVVGYYHGAGPGGDQGFLYSSGIITRVNDPLAGIFGTDPSGINDTGQIVGTYYGPAAGAPVRGFLYNNGTYVDIVDPLDAFAGGTHASGINNSGQIVGYYYDGSGVVLNWPPFRPDTRHNLEGLRLSESTRRGPRIA